MVNENFIPKTETIYELKDEIPSYEEFLKNYKVDERVKDSYESEMNAYAELGKGYGPCDTCKLSTQWADLYIRCPAVGCKSKDDSRSYWYHRWCGGRARISNKARLSCSNCGHELHMSKWNFICTEHTGETDNSVNRKSFNKCLGMALQNEDCDQVISDLVIYITNHKSEWPNN